MPSDPAKKIFKRWVIQVVNFQHNKNTEKEIVVETKLLCKYCFGTELIPVTNCFARTD
jgi:hypothetical protein